MSINSDEINYLVYRYLIESGFVHSAFSFAHESLVSRALVSESDVPPGALVTFLQKGLQYVEIESHLQEDGQERQCDEPFHLLRPHICRIKSAPSAPRKAGQLADGAAAGNPSLAAESAVEVAASDVTVLHGHKSEVFTCAFNPKSDVLATGSGDATARLWQVGERSINGEVPSLTLHHATDSKASKDKTRDVSALDWNFDGSRLATGSYDGRARIWNLDGTLQFTLSGHVSPVFSVQWSPNGSHLLSGSVDKSAIVWDASNGSAKQQFILHTAPILDVDWASPTVFATASTDRTINVCTLGERAATRTFMGHSNEVNAIQWSPSKALLASASDDGTARLWSVAQNDNNGCVATLAGHRKAVYSVKWCPTGEGSLNGSKAPVLATASFDAAVKLWDPVTAKCTFTLSKHTAMVYALAFSPDGSYLASASSDKSVNIWNVADGSLVRTYSAPSGVFDVSFNSTGRKLAACCANSSVTVLDLHM